jgi:hypothetical protein
MVEPTLASGCFGRASPWSHSSIVSSCIIMNVVRRPKAAYRNFGAGPAAWRQRMDEFTELLLQAVPRSAKCRKNAGGNVNLSSLEERQPRCVEWCRDMHGHAAIVAPVTSARVLNA